MQPNITLGAWDVEFISESFCQCYESDNSFLRALPLLAAACVVAVLMVHTHASSSPLPAGAVLLSAHAVLLAPPVQ